MSDPTPRSETHAWEHLPPEQVLAALVYELYTPVSLLNSDLQRLTEDEDELTEEEAEQLFEEMHSAVRQLSKTVYQLKRYTQQKTGIETKVQTGKLDGSKVRTGPLEAPKE
jgi:K+-sensing histidine kinase KdpD